MEKLQVIQNKIYEIRGYKVMLDFDLAEMYQVETRTLNQAVKRNITRFPPDFMFQLANEELEYMSSHFVMTITCQTSEVFFTVRFYGTWCRHADRITELQNEVKELKEYIEEAFADYNDINDDTRMQLELINQTLAELQSKKSISDKPRPRIGFVK